MKTRAKLRSAQHEINYARDSIDNDYKPGRNFSALFSTKNEPESIYSIREREPRRYDAPRTPSRNSLSYSTKINLTAIGNKNVRTPNQKNFQNSPEFNEVVKGFAEFIEEIHKTAKKKGGIRPTKVKFGSDIKLRNSEEEPALKKKLKTAEIVNGIMPNPTREEELLPRIAQSGIVNLEGEKVEPQIMNYKTQEELYNEKLLLSLLNSDDPRIQQYLNNNLLQQQQQLAEEQKLAQSNLDLQEYLKKQQQYNDLLMRNGINPNNMNAVEYNNLLNNMKYVQSNQLQELASLANLANINNINDLNNLIALKSLQNASVNSLSYLENQINQARLRELLQRNTAQPTNLNDLNMMSQMQLSNYYDLYQKYLVQNTMPTPMQNPELLGMQDLLDLAMAKNYQQNPMMNNNNNPLLNKSGYDPNSLALLNDYLNDSSQFLNHQLLQNPLLAQTLQMAALQTPQTIVEPPVEKRAPLKRATYHVAIARYILTRKMNEKNQAHLMPDDTEIQIEHQENNTPQLSKPEAQSEPLAAVIERQKSIDNSPNKINHETPTKRMVAPPETGIIVIGDDDSNHQPTAKLSRESLGQLEREANSKKSQNSESIHEKMELEKKEEEEGMNHEEVADKKFHGNGHVQTHLPDEINVGSCDNSRSVPSTNMDSKLITPNKSTSDQELFQLHEKEGDDKNSTDAKSVSSPHRNDSIYEPPKHAGSIEGVNKTLSPQNIVSKTVMIPKVGIQEFENNDNDDNENKSNSETHEMNNNSNNNNEENGNNNKDKLAAVLQE
jgi:hypothetical protein